MAEDRVGRDAIRPGRERRSPLLDRGRDQANATTLKDKINADLLEILKT